jgi:hypothetical protein
VTRLFLRRGRHAGEPVAADQDVFSRRRGRHCRHGSLTGWAALSQISPAASADDFTRVPVPLVAFPLAAQMIPYPSEEAS